MARIHVLQYIVIGLLSFFFLGCTQQQPIVWDPDRNEAIKYFQQPVVPETDKDYALNEITRGAIFYQNGDRQHSDTRLRNALNVMEQIESDSRESGATAFNENLRTYRGQPYERATAYFYRGLCHFELGHYEKALAAFRAALAEDEETFNEDLVKHKDYIAAYYMAARSLKELGEQSEAESTLASARELFPEDPLLKPEKLNGNTIVVAGVGIGPWMTEGSFWSVDFWAGIVPEGELRVLDQDAVISQLYLAADLLTQADSHKAGEATSAAVGRGISKEFVNIFASALIGRDAGIHEYRDLRCWSGIPRRLYIGSFDLKPGLHTLTFDIQINGKDNKEKVLAERFRQTWYDIPSLDQNRPHLLYVKMLANEQNFHEMAPVQIQDVLAFNNQLKNK